MPVPTAMTEAEVKTYLIVELAAIGTALEWTTASAPVVEALYDTELALGVSDVATETNVAAIRALGALAIWRRAVKALAAQVDTREGDVEGKWSQLHAAALKNLAIAENAAVAYGGGYGVIISAVRYPQDPYAYVLDEDRVL